MTAAVLSWPALFGEALRFHAEVARRSIRSDAPIYVVILVFCSAIAPFVDMSLADWLEGTAAAGFRIFLVLSLVTAVAIRLFVYVTRLKPGSPIRQLVLDAGDALASGFIGRWIPLAFACALLTVGVGRFKSEIPRLAGGFQWDATFAALDRQLHFGTHPYEWLQPLLGFPPITFALNVNYNIWFFLMWGMFIGFAFRGSQTAGRTRFFLSFILVWILCGNLLALVFSSAGPCYFALIGAGTDPYAGLMSYLRDVDTVLPLWALSTQEMLWTDYLNGNPDFGISAMPSMHNSVALLMVLCARDLHPRLRPWLVAHAVLVFLGSVHLGWHYAIDAYLAFAVTALIWWAVTPFARWWDAGQAGLRPAGAAVPRHA